jgi:K+-transporting ATPase KdpF subunit
VSRETPVGIVHLEHRAAYGARHGSRDCECIEVNAMTFEYILGGVVAGLAMLYLFYVLFWPERF